MVHRTSPRIKRRGAALLETGLVVALMMTFIFGVIEYSRLLMIWNLANNAAREGCRYALVHNTATTISSDVQTVVTNYMAGQASSLSNFTVTVSGTHGGVNTAVNNLGPGDLISVNVSGTFTFLNIVPIIKMPTSLTISSGVAMVCEGGT